ncbi:MAG: porin [Nannocystaceae bacterium]
MRYWASLLFSLALAGAPRIAAADPGAPPEPTPTPAASAAATSAAEPTRRPRFAPGKGVTVESEDGRWALRASLRTGVQATVVHPNAAGTTTQAGAELRRLRVVLSGHALGKHNRYFFQLGFAPRDRGHDGEKSRYTPLLDAYVDFTYLRDLTLRVGQCRPQYNRERLILDINPLLIDRSIANAEFNFDRDLGLDLRSDDLLGLGLMRYYAGVFLGRGRDPRGVGVPGFLYVARVEFLPLGIFDDYDSADLSRERRLRVAFGGAYAFHDRARNDRGVLGTPPADGGTTDYHNATVDLLVKYAGLYLEAGLLWRRGRRHPGDAVDERGVPLPIAPARSGNGWFVQASYLLPRTRLEPALRYAEVRPLGVLEATTSLTPRSELGGGLNVYVHGHDLKVQLDYFRLWETRAIDVGDDQVRAPIQIAF